jgi:hypothetical protein
MCWKVDANVTGQCRVLTLIIRNPANGHLLLHQGRKRRETMQKEQQKRKEWHMSA